VLTSDGISESTLKEIYQRAYLHRFVHGAVDLFALYPNREVLQVTGDEQNGWKLAVAHNDLTGVTEELDVDVIVWATGFRPARMDFLAPIAHRVDREGDEYRIDESFAVVWDGPPDRNIFVQNAARQQRGLADPNLSLMAWRSQRIVDRIRGVNTENQTPSFIEWSAKEVVAP
jgi:lysine N6-hydroxylase